MCSEKEPVTVRIAGDAYLGYDLAQIGEMHHPCIYQIINTTNISSAVLQFHSYLQFYKLSACIVIFEIRPEQSCLVWSLWTISDDLQKCRLSLVHGNCRV